MRATQSIEKKIQVSDELESLRVEVGRSIERRIPPYLRSQIDLDDVLQETWVRAVARVSQFEKLHLNSMKHWLSTIAANVVNENIRRKNTTKRGGDALVFNVSQFDRSSLRMFIADSIVDGETPSRMYEGINAIRNIKKAISALPVHEQELIRARYVESYEVTQIAQQRSMTRAALSMALKRIRNRIRVFLENCSDD